MSNLQKNLNSELAKYQLWAADQMKIYAEKTTDPQLKKKYEQITALNRMFYQNLLDGDEDNNIGKKELDETDMLMRTFFVQNAVYRVFSEQLFNEHRPKQTDEICDRLVMICRELLDEAEIRKNVINL